VAPSREARPEPAGFGNCPECPYAATGTPGICFDCASETLEQLSAKRCDYCELPLRSDGSCGNPICNWSEEDRQFDWVYAISMRSGVLRSAIDRYKVHGVEGWAWIFGRVLVGYLQENDDTFERFDVIVPSPTYVGDGGRSFDHTGLVIERAKIEDPSMPFETGVVTKSQATPAFRGRTWQERYAVATTQLRQSLELSRPEVITDKNVLVYDDVFTEGLTACEVARALRQGGAASVSQIVLARQPWDHR
jgi:predicted amidophosphoribosyltransferase